MANVIKIVDGQPKVVEDAWNVVRNIDAQAAGIVPVGAIVPFPAWKSTCSSGSHGCARAVWISPDDDFEPHVQQLTRHELIAVDFPSFRDGRGYSIGYLLRTRYGWTGELRAIGDVLRDQLNYMRRCGFDAFAVRADKNIHDALKGFSRYSVQYQGAVDEPLPLFRRGRTA
jgi:uncharacterized protein (DUF934 family)